MNIWRIAGIALAAGLALFLVTIILKFLFIALAAALMLRVVGGFVAYRFFGKMRQGSGHVPSIISIDNPAYRSPMSHAGYERIIPIN